MAVPCGTSASPKLPAVVPVPGWLFRPTLAAATRRTAGSTSVISTCTCEPDWLLAMAPDTLTYMFQTYRLVAPTSIAAALTQLHHKHVCQTRQG